MARIYKPVTVRYLLNGKQVPAGTPGARKRKVKSKTWRAEYRDGDGLKRTVSLKCTDKAAAQQLLTGLVKSARDERLGLSNPRLEEHASRPLTQHLADFETSLESKARSASHIEGTISRVRAILTSCEFQRVRDLDAERVSNWLANRRAAGMSVATSNHYATAAKAFGKWLVANRRATQNPLAHLSKLNGETDVRRERRALSADAFGRLLKAARGGKTICGLTGEQRHLLYCVAARTGLRASEIASLNAQSFDIDAENPTVTIEAGSSKRRRRDTLPIHPDLIPRLREWLELNSAPAGDSSIVPMRRNAAHANVERRLFPGNWAKHRHGAEMVRYDLRVARLAWLKETRGAERIARKRTDFLCYLDADGLAFDFHALRSQFITGLSRAGVSLAEAQRLARHSDPRLTSRHYTHLSVCDLATAVERLPSLTTTQDALRATGTADVRAVVTSGSEKNVAVNVAAPIAIHGYSSPSIATIDATELQPAENEKPPAKIDSQGESSGENEIRTRDAGFPTYRISNPALETPNAKPPKDLAKRRILSCRESCCPIPESDASAALEDADLERLVERWSTLPAKVRRKILALLDAAGGSKTIKKRTPKDGKDLRRE